MISKQTGSTQIIFLILNSVLHDALPELLYLAGGALSNFPRMANVMFTNKGIAANHSQSIDSTSWMAIVI